MGAFARPSCGRLPGLSDNVPPESQMLTPWLNSRKFFS